MCLHWQVKAALVHTAPVVLSPLCSRTFIHQTSGGTGKAPSPSTRYHSLSLWRSCVQLMLWCECELCCVWVSNCAPVVQVTVSEEGSVSGTLQRSKKSKRNWKRLWFLLKDKVLYTYRAQEVRGNMHSPWTYSAFTHALKSGHFPETVCENANVQESPCENTAGKCLEIQFDVGQLQNWKKTNISGLERGAIQVYVFRKTVRF